MSDKMLMEDWRKYLGELKGDTADYAPEEPEEDSPELSTVDPLEGAGKLERTLSYIRTHKEDVESAADRLIEELPDVSDFWKDIFDADNWDRTHSDLKKDFDDDGSPRQRGQVYDWEYPDPEVWTKHMKERPSENPEDIVNRYHANGTLKGGLEEWLNLTTLVLICRQTNVDHTNLERVQRFTDFMGEGSSGFSKALKWGAIGLGAIAGGAKAIGAALLTYTFGGPISTHINDRVRQKDMTALSRTLEQKLGIKRSLQLSLRPEEFDMAKAVSLEDDFHSTEYQVMKALKQNPDSLPSVEHPRTGASVSPVDALREEKQKLYDNWRNFLLTEEKL